MNKLPNPNDLFKAEANNCILHTALDGWRNGYMSFEQALIMACVILAGENNKLMENATINFIDRGENVKLD